MLPSFENATVGPQCTYSTYVPNGCYTLFKYERELWRLLQNAETSRTIILKNEAFRAMNRQQLIDNANMACPIYRQFVEHDLAVYFAKNGTKGE